MFRFLLAASLALTAVAAAGIGGFTASEAASAPKRSVAPAPELSQLFGFVDGALVRIDAQSFRPLPGTRVHIGSGGCAPRQGGTACWSIPPWTVSPDGRQLAVARNDASSMSVVDVAGMRTTAKLRIEGGEIGAIAWLAPGRMLAIQEASGERQRLLAIDLRTRKVVARAALGGSVEQLVKTGREIVMLLAPARAIGAARIAVADRGGAVRFARVGRILAGSKLRPTPGHRVDSRLPGLAVDPRERRAYVVDQTLVAEIDLRSLAVSYHSLERKPSMLARLWNWLEPAASAKLVSGYHRQASWLADGLLVVSGTDTEEGRWRPAGLLAMDTRSWQVRTIDPGATSFRIADDLLLTWGAGWDAATRRTIGIGLTAYDLEGEERFQLFEGQSTWVAQVYGGRAYVGVSGEKELRVVDLATGSAVATRPEPLPWLLLGSGDGWWGA